MGIHLPNGRHAAVVSFLVCMAFSLVLNPGRVNAAPHLAPEDIVVDLVQTGRGGTDDQVRGALVFRLRAYDETVGERDGDGIASVELRVLDPEGNEVYRRRENNAGYCAFSGGEPNCTGYVFAEHDNAWPNGEPIRDGEFYTLAATIQAKDGSRTTFARDVELQLADSSDLRVDVVRTGRNNTTLEVRNELVFRVRANDPTEGNRDGDGIDGADMIILDANGDEVYRKRETDAGYCAFGGGVPNCGVYNFAQNGYRWPDRDGERGDQIRRGDQYTLRTIIDADDGRSTTVDTTIVIR